LKDQQRRAPVRVDLSKFARAHFEWPRRAWLHRRALTSDLASLTARDRKPEAAAVATHAEGKVGPNRRRDLAVDRGPIPPRESLPAM